MPKKKREKKGGAFLQGSYKQKNDTKGSRRYELTDMDESAVRVTDIYMRPAEGEAVSDLPTAFKLTIEL